MAVGLEPCDGDAVMTSEIDPGLRSVNGRERRSAPRAWSTDTTATRRDRLADARDVAAEARDELAAALDAQLTRLAQAVDEELEDRPRNGLELLLRAARARKLAAESLAHAAAIRENAARDRAMARMDRIHAAADRRRAAHALASEGVDHLTGALRRRVGLAAIGRDLDRARRTGAALTVAFIDVNGLKTVNDTHGHDAGDALLRCVAECINTALRTYDVFMRFGGDEFVCSLAGQDLAGAQARFSAIAARIALVQPEAGITVGFATSQADDSLDELIARADHAMIARRSRN